MAELETYKRMLEDALSLTTDARREGEIDQDYYDGLQWTADERRTLADRKQPDLVFNRIRPAVNGTLGVLKQGTTDPRAYPRNPQDEQSADVASKVLRYIADKSNFDALKIDVSKDFMVQGTGAAIVEFADDVKITQIRWEEFFYDPRSRRQDFADARYLGVAKWVYADDLIAQYPDKKSDIESAVTDGSMSLHEGMQDRPKNGVIWIDRRKRRLMLVEVYHKEGGWKRCVFHAGGVLEEGESPYQDDKGQPCCPIEAQSCFIDRENNRYGIVRDMRGPQDEINKRRSKLLHLVNSSQIKAVDETAIATDVEIARKEAARPDGVLPPGWDKVSTADMAAGQAQLLAEAKAEIERMGPNPAILGRQGADTSGRAQLVRQQAGLTEQAIIFGGIEEWELRCYRQMWNRARQFYQAPKWVRITDDEGAPEFVGVNQPVMGPFGPEVQNPIAQMDVDIIIDTTPDTANVQQEQFAMLVELAKVGALGQNAGPLLLEASSLPNKRQVLDKLQAQEPNPAQELAQRGAQANVAKTEAEVSKTQADAALTAAKAKNEMLGGAVAQAMAASYPPPGFTGAPPPVA